jgi:hypothetical protein
MNYVILVVILAILVLLGTKFKSLIFKAKDNKFVKEDERLVQIQKKQEQDITEAKAEIAALKAEDLPPDMVEEFWKKKK